MGDFVASDPDAEPQILVEVTPRDFGRRARFCIIGGLLLLTAAIVLDARFGKTFVNPVLAVAVVGYGVYCQVQARRQVTRTLLRIDRSGIHSGDGLYDQTWNQVVMVWVGSSTGLRLPFVDQPVLSVFTQVGIEFATRAGTRPKALYSVPVGLPRRVDRLCAELRAITDATIVNGHETSRSTAAGLLQQPGSGRTSQSGQLTGPVTKNAPAGPSVGLDCRCAQGRRRR